MEAFAVYAVLLAVPILCPPLIPFIPVLVLGSAQALFIVASPLY